MKIRLMQLDNSLSFIGSSVLESSIRCAGRHIAITLAKE